MVCIKPIHCVPFDVFAPQIIVSLLLLLVPLISATWTSDHLHHHRRNRRSFGWPPWQTATVSASTTTTNQLPASDDASPPSPATLVHSPALASTETAAASPLPAELQQLARDFGVRDLRRLPSLDEAQALLGTATADETVQAVLDIAATADGRDLIREFLQSGDYADVGDVATTAATAPSLLNTVDATLDRTHTNLDVLRNVIGAGEATTVAPPLNNAAVDNSYGFFGNLLGALFYGRGGARREEVSTTTTTTTAAPSVEAVKQRPLVQRPAAVVVPIVVPVVSERDAQFARK